MDTPDGFDDTSWVERFGGALEKVAAGAWLWNFPPPVLPAPIVPIEVYREAYDRAYRTLAERARHDPEAAAQFAMSSLTVDHDPAEAMTIVREHPVVKSAPGVSDGNLTIRFRLANRLLFTDLKTVVLNLVKLSFQCGGQDAALRMHRYLTAIADGRVPAHEIIVIHGLSVKRRYRLGQGAYLASYKDIRTEFNLPDKPDLWPEKDGTDPAVLVRKVECGPGLIPDGHDVGLPDTRVGYRFPTEYHCDLKSWFDDSGLLVDLFSVVLRAPLQTRTRFVCVPAWVGEIDPNAGAGASETTGWRSYVPSKTKDDLIQSHVDAFVELAHGWYSHPDRKPAMAGALGRLAGSFSRPGGPFGQQDRILDVAIALEVLYGGKTGHRLARRAAALLGTSADEQTATYDHARGFYHTRSAILHTDNKQPPPIDQLDQHLQAGQDLGCRTLTALLQRQTPPDWANIQKNLEPDAQNYIEQRKPRKNTSCCTPTTHKP